MLSLRGRTTTFLVGLLTTAVGFVPVLAAFDVAGLRRRPVPWRPPRVDTVLARCYKAA